jgi:ABC-type transport system involved in multi-copper enzyme maturation permease subunit
MDRILAIALNTFREAVRDRVLYGVLGFATAVLLFTLALAELSLDQQRRVVLDVGLASISMFSVVIAVFLGSSLLYKEIQRKTLYVILPKPLRRWEFVVGKFVGIALTASVFIGVMGAVQLYVTAIQAQAATLYVVAAPIALAVAFGVALWRAEDKTRVAPVMSLVALITMTGVCATTEADVRPVLEALVLVIGEVVLLAAVAMLFSSFSTPFLTGAFTIGVWLLGRSADAMASMQSPLIPGGVRSMLHVLGWAMPNFHLFVPSLHALEPAEGAMSPELYVGQSLAYACVYAAALLVVSCAVFQRRDLT